MTIQEAIKSGKRFKQPNSILIETGEPAWYGPYDLTAEEFEAQDFDIFQILSNDWEIEIEEEKIEITRDQLINAFYKAQASTGACFSYRYVAHLTQQSLVEAMAKELGFNSCKLIFYEAGSGLTERDLK